MKTQLYYDRLKTYLSSRKNGPTIVAPKAAESLLMNISALGLVALMLY